MTLKEAIESGKSFKRKDDAGWSLTRTTYHPFEVIAEDWVTEDQVKSITETQAEEAFKRVAGVIFKPQAKKEFMKILGFTNEE